MNLNQYELIQIDCGQFAEFLNERGERWFFNQMPEYIRFLRGVSDRTAIYMLKDKGEPVMAAKVTLMYSKRFYRIAYFSYIPKCAYSEEQFEAFVKLGEAELRKNKKVVEVCFAPMELRRIWHNDGTAEDLNENLVYERILQNNGYKYYETDMYLGQNAVQPRFMYVKKIEGMSEKEVFASLESRVRSHMRVCERYGMKLRPLEKEEYSVFNDYLKETAVRTNTNEHMLIWAKPEMWEAGAFDFVAVVLNVKEALKQNEQDQSELLAEIASYPEEPSRKQRGRKIQAEQMLAACENRLERLSEIAEKHGQGEVILSVVHYARSKSDVMCMQSATADEFVDLSPVYLAHDVYLRKAVESGSEYYNFFYNSGPESKIDQGVIDFKKQFNGFTEEFIGTYGKMIRKPLLYRLLSLLKR